jgi:hypothetical protein
VIFVRTRRIAGSPNFIGMQSLHPPWSIELARCKYCGELTDHIRRVHPDCEVNFQLGERQIAMEVAGAVSAGGDLEGLPARIAMVARDAFISEERARRMVISGWRRAVQQFQQTTALNEEEERRLIRLEYLFGLTQADLHAFDGWVLGRADAA